MVEIQLEVDFNCVRRVMKWSNFFVVVGKHGSAQPLLAVRRFYIIIIIIIIIVMNRPGLWCIHYIMNVGGFHNFLSR